MNDFPYRKAFLLGFGFFGISIIWVLFNNFVPILLVDFGLSATLIGFIMTWDNYFNMFIQPVVGGVSDRTQTRIGRRKPWLLIGAPLAAIFFITIPLMPSWILVMFAILLTNIGMGLFRSPAVALMGDLFPPQQRNIANGIMDVMGGVGAIVALIGGGVLYQLGRVTPFLFGSLVMLTSILLVLRWVNEPKVPALAENKAATIGFMANLRQILAHNDRSGLMIMLAILCSFLSVEAILTWLSSFGKFTLGINPERMSLIFIGFALPFLIFAVPSGLIANRFGRQRTILVGLMAMILVLVSGCFIQNEVMLIGVLILAGTSWPLVSVNALPIVYDVCGDAHIGAFTGLYYFLVSVAAVVGPQLVGILIDLTGQNYRMVFVVAACSMTLAALFMAQVKQNHQTIDLNRVST